MDRNETDMRTTTVAEENTAEEIKTFLQIAGTKKDGEIKMVHIAIAAELFSGQEMEQIADGLAQMACKDKRVGTFLESLFSEIRYRMLAYGQDTETETKNYS